MGELRLDGGASQEDGPPVTIPHPAVRGRSRDGRLLQKGESMHEMSLVGDVIRVAERYGRENDATRVVAVNLVIGEMRDVVDHLLDSCFAYLSRGTIVEGAKLNVRKVPLRPRCADCNTVFTADAKHLEGLACPRCHGTRLSMYEGGEFFIQNIVVA